MMRPVQPNDKQGDFASESTKSPGKRRRVTSACVPCRERKTKCDGVQPKCSTCKALYNTRCSYDFDGGRSRKSTTRRRTTAFTREKESAIAIIRAIKSCPMAEVTNIINAIRANDNLDVIAENLGKNAILLDESNISMTGGQPDRLIGSSASLHHLLSPPQPYQNNLYHESVVPNGPPIPSLANPLSYDSPPNFSWSPSIDGSASLPNYTAVSQMGYPAGLPQPGDQWHLYYHQGYQASQHQSPQSSRLPPNGLPQPIYPTSGHPLPPLTTPSHAFQSYPGDNLHMARSQAVPTTMMSLADPNGQTFAPYAPTANTYFNTQMNFGSPASELAIMVDGNYSGGLREGIEDHRFEKAPLTESWERGRRGGGGNDGI
ncbi:hypothetical protein JMJ35_000011 [Cladonia borealis]|uniref:Zn(2)-C6 fungal-type domain-containing protein n=1 Tax=Cladonia borealis TaxID=184061 RepID=A0AA39R9Z1_9LECA|nr:hypothetical protein JMJ35_000011 [Cladonia borealis]